MTHKSIDALLASTMFLLFTMVTPHYEDIAKKIGFVDSAYAIANTTSYSSTTSSASNSSANMTVTNTATSTTATTFNFMTTLSATTPVSHPVSGSSQNVELGHFLVINSGPDMKITDIAFKMIGTISPLWAIDNIQVSDSNGSVIGSVGSTNGSTFYLTNLSRTIPSGKDLKLVVKANISSGVTSGYNGKTVGISFIGGKAINTSDNTVVGMGSSVNANLMTLSTANIAKPNVSLSSTTPASQTAIAGSRYVPIAHFNINNPTGSDINIGSFVLWEKGSVGNIQGLELYDSSNTQISEHLTGQDGVNGFYFSKLSLVVKANSSAKIIVKADISSTAVSGSKTGVAFGKGGGYKLVDNTAVELGGDPDINANLMTVTTSTQSINSITLLTPNGGENFPVGGKMAVYWKTSSDIPATMPVSLQFMKTGKDYDKDMFQIDLGKNDGNEIVYIPKNTNGGVPIIGGLYYVRIVTSSADGTVALFDSADSQVGIKADSSTRACATDTAPWVQVLSPNGGEIYKAGEEVTVKWTSCNIKGDGVNISIVPNFSSKYGTASTLRWVDSGYAQYNMPDAGFFTTDYLKYGSYYKIGIADAETNKIEDVSNATFSIVDPASKAQDPKGAENSDQTTTFTRRLSMGKKGDDVMLLQEILIDQGFLTITNPTGFYGQGTYRAVQRLQKANNIAQTGNVGPATRTLLNSIIAKMDVSGND